MNTYKQLLPRTILLGSVGLAAMLLVSTPSCKAPPVQPRPFHRHRRARCLRSRPGQGSRAESQAGPARLANTNAPDQFVRDVTTGQAQ